MDTDFDRKTEGQREKTLMRRIRSGEISEAGLERELLPFPVKIQIQTISPCNASCIMCPWPQTKDVLPQGAMKEEVYRAVVEQIRGRGVERVGLFLNNEPTLDVRLDRFTAILKEALPDTTALIFTNGLRFTAERAQALADGGMDEVTVSIVGFDRPSFERIMIGVDYDVVMKNLNDIGVLAAAGRLGTMRISVVGLEFPGQRELLEAFRARTGLEADLKHVNNLAGLVDLDAIGVQNAMAREPIACQRPFVKAYVLYDGELVLCNCDWMRTTTFGNVMKTTIEEIWRGERLAAIRRQHLRRRFDADSLCARCDYPYLP
jgi:radical SAM protein with 4Fe4S-binding SPASM domain